MLDTGAPQEVKEVKTEFDYELICGVPIEVGNVGHIHPLTLREIGSVGMKTYDEHLSLLTFDKDTLPIESTLDISEKNSFDVLTEYCKKDKTFKLMMEMTLSLFLREKTIFISEYEVFIVGEIEDLDDLKEDTVVRIIHRENFEKIVYIIKLQNKIKVKDKVKKPKLSKKAQALADKRNAGRKLIAESKGQGQEGTTLEGLISTCGVFTKDINKVLNWTVYQLHDQYDIFMREENYKYNYEKYLVGEDPKKLNLDKHWTMK